MASLVSTIPESTRRTAGRWIGRRRRRCGRDRLRCLPQHCQLVGGRHRLPLVRLSFVAPGTFSKSTEEPGAKWTFSVCVCVLGVSARQSINRLYGRDLRNAQRLRATQQSGPICPHRLSKLRKSPRSGAIRGCKLQQNKDLDIFSGATRESILCRSGNFCRCGRNR